MRGRAVDPTAGDSRASLLVCAHPDAIEGDVCEVNTPVIAARGYSIAATTPWIPACAEMTDSRPDDGMTAHFELHPAQTVLEKLRLTSGVRLNQNTNLLVGKRT